MGLSGSSFGIDLLVKIVPRNPVKAAADGDMLAVIFFSLMLGVALTTLSGRRPSPCCGGWTAWATSRSPSSTS